MKKKRIPIVCVALSVFFVMSSSPCLLANASSNHVRYNETALLVDENDNGEINERGAGIIDPTCPECGEAGVPLKSWYDSATYLLWYTYECSECGYIWNTCIEVNHYDEGSEEDNQVARKTLEKGILYDEVGAK